MPKRIAHLLPRLLWSTRGGTPHETLVRLFLLNRPVDEAALRAAFGPVDPEYWVDAGLLQYTAEGYKATLRLTPYRDMVIAADPNDQATQGASINYVMPITYSAITIAHCMVRRRVKRTLDIGSGTGVLSFLAASHSAQVIGVDCNPRAVAVSRFNAALNHFEHVDFVEGQSFQPVADQKFDHIISNPPFMISPEVRYTFRDAGADGDGFVLNLAREAVSHLEEGGIAQIVGDFINTANETAEQRLEKWFESAGCDVWFLKMGTKTNAMYAENWLDATEPDDLEVAQGLYRQWLDYYGASGVESVTTGLLNLRKATGKRNWFHFDDIPEGKSGPVGDHIVRRFLVGDFLERSDDEVLLGTLLRVAPELRLVQECEWSPGSWRISQSELKLAGVPYHGLADRYTVALLARVDGTRTVRALLEELAAAAGVQFDQVAAGGLELIRHLIERGFLLPVEETVQ